MSRRRVIATGASVLLALACGRAGLQLPWSEDAWSPRPTTALVEVEVLSGFGGLPPEPPGPMQVEVLIDVSSSMTESAGARTSRSEAARQAAARLVRGLPSSTSIRLSALGIRARDCQPAQPLARGKPGGSRQEVLSWIDALESAGEGSLAGALDWLAAGAEPRHVVVFTDLGAECGGDLCAAAAGLASNGSRLDLVVVGDAPTPDCIADFALDNGPEAGRDSRYEPPEFVVRKPGPNGWTPIARARADGTRIVLPAGLTMLRVEFESPMYIGPISFDPATITRVQILDFPDLDEPVREWHSDTRPIDPLQEAS